MLIECPQEIIDYKDIKIFSKREMEEMRKGEVEVSKIGDVKLDDDEISVLKLPPKFAVYRKLDTLDMKTETEMAMAKVRYQNTKRN